MLRRLLHVSNPMVQLQEDGCIYSYFMIRFTCVGMSSPVGKRVSIHFACKTVRKTACKTYDTITVYKLPN